ncbi:transcription initiation factor TFIID subunit 8 [Chamberlinius hualienensis]
MSEIVSNVNPRRRTLYTSVAAICTEVGFHSADKVALETLTEMLQSLLNEIGRSSRAFAELACRTEPLVGDVVMSLVDAGLPVEGLIAYSRRHNAAHLPAPGPMLPPHLPRILQAGQKRKHPSHILEHFPSFPDPHAYIRTPTHKQPVTEYPTIREKAASQKRDIERALTRFVAKTCESQTLFYDDQFLFPLIPCKPMSFPYLNALLPKDQFSGEEDDTKEANTSATETANTGKGGESAGEGNEKLEKEKNKGAGTSLGAGGDEEEPENETIDNPYLRSIKLPKKKKK